MVVPGVGVAVARVTRLGRGQLLGGRRLGRGVEILDLGLAEDAVACSA